MAKFLLWNVQRKRLDSLIVGLVDAEQIDVVMLVERPATPGLLPGLLAQRGLNPVPSLDRFAVFAKAATGLIPHAPVISPIRANMFRIAADPARPGFILLVHGHDPRNHSDATRTAYFGELADIVRAEERVAGHKRTLIAGDFNANPFDPAVVGANGLHALGLRRVKDQTSRTFLSRDFDFFYNPMWRLFGHGADSGSATHHYHGYDAVEYLWHMLDQVVIRPEALGTFPESEVRIISRVGAIPLVDGTGLPDSAGGSDHLPLVFRWDI